MAVSVTESGHRHDTQADSVTIAEAAVILGVTERTIARLIKRKALISQKRKGHRFISRQSLQSYASKQRVQSASLDSIEKRLAHLEQLLLGLIELYQPDSMSALNRKRELLAHMNKSHDERNE